MKAIVYTKFGPHEVNGVCSAASLEWVQSFAASQVINYTREYFGENGKTYEIILDTVGKISFSACKGSLADGGNYLLTVPTPAILPNKIVITVDHSTQI